MKKLTEKLKQASKHEFETNFQVLRLSNENKQLKEDKAKLEAQKNQQKTYIDKNQADDIKYHILSGIRDSLKKKLVGEENKKNQ